MPSTEKTIGHCSKGDSCSFRHELASGTDAGWTKRAFRYHSKGTDWREYTLLKVQAAEVKALLGEETEIRAGIFLEESVRMRHAICGSLPCVTMRSMNPDARIATNVDSDMLRLVGSSAESQKKKVVYRSSSFIEVVHTIGMCTSRFLSEKIYFYGKKEHCDQIPPSKISMGTWHHIKFRERKGPTRGIILKVWISWAQPVASPSLWRGHKMKLCIKKNKPAEWHGTWQKLFISSKRDKATFYSPIEARTTPAHFKTSKRNRIRGGLQSISAHAEQKGLEHRRTGHPFAKSRNPTTVVTANGESAYERGSTSVRSRYLISSGQCNCSMIRLPPYH